MLKLLTVAGLSLLLSATTPLAASAQSEVAVASLSCGLDGWCDSTPRPVGFYVTAVEEDGRYVALEDGTVWEIEISDRATTAAWRADDFVAVREILAPMGDFNYLLTLPGNSESRAAARPSFARAIRCRRRLPSDVGCPILVALSAAKRLKPKVRPRKLRVIPSQVSGDAVEIGEQAPLVHADQVELVPEAGSIALRDDELGEGRAQVVPLQELVERLPLVGAKGEGGRLGNDPRVQ